MKIRNKIIGSISVIAIFSILAITFSIDFISSDVARKALELEEKSQLISIRDIKKNQIEDYFTMISNQLITYSDGETIQNAMQDFKSSFKNYLLEAKDQKENYKASVVNSYLKFFNEEYAKRNGGLNLNTKLLVNVLDNNSFSLQYKYILNNQYPIGEKYKLDSVQDGTNYSKFHAKYHPMIREYAERFGFYDIFLVDPNSGEIIYSLAKELDYTTSLINGEFSKTGLANAFRLANNSDDKNYVGITDFSPYRPSYDEQSAFMATPIMKNGKKLGILIFQIPIDKINNIMTNNQEWEELGLSHTGESIIVGNDYKLRSMSRFFIENPEGYLSQMKNIGVSEEIIGLMATKKTSIGLQKSETVAVKKALAGESGFIIANDYRDVSVLVAYDKLAIGGVDWAIITQIDKEEAFLPIAILKENIWLISIAVMCVVIGLSIIFGVAVAAKISTPIENLQTIILQLAKTQDLTKRIKVTSSDEISEVAEALNKLLSSLQQTLQTTVSSTKQLKTEAKKLYEIAQKNDGENKSSEQVSLKNTTDSIQEMSNRLESLSSKFRLFEDEQDRASGW